MSKMSYAEAISDSVAIEMRQDPNIAYVGEDPVGGAQQVFMGAWCEFPERFIVAPITETANAGCAIGASMCGMRMILDMMYADFIPVAMDEIYNQAANVCYTYNGNGNCPVVIRAMCGNGTSEGLQHSHSIENLFAHIPGLKVVMPTFPDDAKGLMTSSLRDNGPLIFLTHRKLGYNEGEVPDNEYLVPLGKAKVVREGKDVTLVSWSYPVMTCLQAAEYLVKKGIDAEVIDLRTIVPWDKECIKESVRKTGRLVVVSEENHTGSFAGEIAATLAEEVFNALKGPIKRVTSIDAPVPIGKLEDMYLITPEKIEKAVMSLF
jgi:pyruvate dehydrogenase E1 component beta subunit